MIWALVQSPPVCSIGKKSYPNVRKALQRLVRSPNSLAVKLKCIPTGEWTDWKKAVATKCC